MNQSRKNLSLVLAAGCFGGLMKGLAAWLFGAMGLCALLGSRFAPPLSPAWIYSHVVWGGIWALLFLLPLKGFSYYSLGVIYSLPQTLIALLVLFPRMNRGFLGLGLGSITPVLILFFGVVWGITTAFWLKLSKES
jgi:hypothetical protein